MKQIITILNRPASKKNSKQVFYRNGRYNVISSKAYTAFEKDALTQLLIYKRYRIDYPVRVTYTFYQKGKYTQDYSNASGTIDDILEKAGILENDKWIKEAHIYIKNGASDWKTEIIIEDIKLATLAK